MRIPRTLLVALALLACLGAVMAQEEEKKKEKRELPPVERIEETVDLSLMKRAPDFIAFMERHSFPMPEGMLWRFNVREVAGRPVCTAIYRLSGADEIEKTFKGFQESLGVNRNVSADATNRVGVFQISPLKRNKTANGTLLYHNPEAGYTLAYNVQVDYDRDQVIMTVSLKTCEQSMATP